MIRREIYPKTKRVPVEGGEVHITEKLDGSNLTIFKWRDELYIAQRKNIYTLSEFLTEGFNTQPIYKGLYQWIQDNGLWLRENLHTGSAICGEWLGMGQIKYDQEEFPNRFNMFAKGNILDDEFTLQNLIYDTSLFKYSFIDVEVPAFIGIVPLIETFQSIPSKQLLDTMYDTYCLKTGRNVEGFIVNYRNVISKYVRMKNGKLAEHFDRG